MKHECGGKIDMVSVVKTDDNKCIVTLVCASCGETVIETHYLYE
jgi:hypothetical protein